MSNIFSSLQFFADGGGAGAGAGTGAGPAGGDGAPTGVNAVNPGQEDNLEALGVPKDKAAHYRKIRGSKPAEAQPDVAAPTEADQTEPVAKADPWDEFMANPENNKRLQNMINDRLKSYAKSNDQSKAQLKGLEPALKLLSEKYHVDLADGKVNVDALSQAIVNDESFYEDEAIRLGVDNSTARELVQLRAERAAAEQARAEQEQDLMIRRHVDNLQKQADKIRETWPDFDLQKEIQNPVFWGRTLPESGMSLEEALFSMYGKQMLEKQAAAIADKTNIALANKIASGRSRPQENGGNTAPPAQKMVDRSSFNSYEDYQNYIKKKYPSSNY